MNAVFVAFLIVSVLAADSPVPGKKTLVIYEKNDLIASHSMFFDNLKEKGCELSYINVKDTVEISKYGEFLYDNIVIMVESNKKYASLNFEEFRSFLDFHGSIFVMFGNSPSDFIRNLAGYSGVEIDATESRVVDHFTAVDGDNFKHTKFMTSNFPKISRLVGDLSNSDGSIIFQGTGMRVDENNVLAIRALAGDLTTVSVSSTGTVQAYASEVVLVAAVQTRSNNRIVITGSLSVFSNSYYVENLNNQIFGNQISLWSFKFFGYLRVNNIEHYKYIREEDRIVKEHEILVQTVKKANLPTSQYPEPEVAGNNVVYNVKDELYYSVNVQEFDGKEWKPYAADDMQIEFVMLDPYVRKNLTYVAEKNNGDYNTIIKVPDVYGIYKFRLFYQRQGVSLISENTQVSIRPFKHDEYPRFILAAYPYYTNMIIMMLGFVVFVFIYLFAGEKQKQD